MLYIIANRLSGSGKGAACLEATEKLLTQKGVEFKTLVSEYAGHIPLLTRQACSNLDCRRIIAIGGDGTFSELLSGLDLSVPVAFIPAGTGNDFVKGAALPTEVVSGVEAALHAKPTLYDILAVNDKRCLNIAGTGFDVNVLLQEQKIRKIYKGKLSYTLALLRALLKLEFTDIEYSADGNAPKKLSAFLIAAANGKYYGGGLPICLDADCTDGFLDLVIIKKLPRLAVPSVLIKFLKGKLAQVTEYVEMQRCKTLTFHTTKAIPVNIDGELFDGLLPAKIEILPKRLQVLK